MQQGTSLRVASVSALRDVPYVPFEWRAAHKIVRADLPAALVDGQRARQLQAFASEIPGQWHWGMYEVRLAARDTQVDVLASVVQDDEPRRRLMSAAVEDGPHLLKPVAPTLRSWASGDGLVGSTPNLWLEWDLDGAGNPAMMWLCVAPDFFDKNRPPPRPSETGDLAQAFMNTDASLAVDGAAKKVAELAARLPRGGKLISFASLRSRGRPICKAFACLPPGKTEQWLEAIGWPGDRQQLRGLGHMFSGSGERQWCQVEFDSQLRPYLGLELAQTQRGFPGREARVGWLSEVVDRGWASQEKAQAVLNWHGPRESRLPNGEPVDLLRSFHLKLTMSPGSTPVAKAYLGFYFRRTAGAANTGVCTLM